jgi:hypothetical protein
MFRGLTRRFIVDPPRVLEPSVDGHELEPDRADRALRQTAAWVDALGASGFEAQFKKLDPRKGRTATRSGRESATSQRIASELLWTGLVGKRWSYDSKEPDVVTLTVQHDRKPYKVPVELFRELANDNAVREPIICGDWSIKRAGSSLDLQYRHNREGWVVRCSERTLRAVAEYLERPSGLEPT